MAAAATSTLRVPTVTEADLHAFHQTLFGAPFAGGASLGAALQQERQHDGNPHPANAAAHHPVGDRKPGHIGGKGSDEQGNDGTGLAEEEYYDNEEYYYEEEEEEEEEDDLGYYPDGVKRTLTDDQIAIFRHSEIQALLRERTLIREAQEAEQSEDEGSAPQEPPNAGMLEGLEASSDEEEGELADEQPPKAKDSGRRSDGPMDASSDPEEREYAAFLRAERLEFQRAAAARRNGERHTYDPDDRTISTRRRVREMDGGYAQTQDALMYDDGDGNGDGDAAPAGKFTHATGKDSTRGDSTGKEGEIAGRRFWWPEIRPGG